MARGHVVHAHKFDAGFREQRPARRVDVLQPHHHHARVILSDVDECARGIRLQTAGGCHLALTL